MASQYPSLELQLVGAVGLLPLPLLRLTADHPAVHDAIGFYGDGPFARFRLQIVQAGTSYRDALLALLPPSLSRRVLWSGPVPHAALPALYRAADILVAPSVWEEPFGIPIAEAMASGLPVVATNSGGIPEQVVDGESGILVPRGDAVALAGALRWLLDDSEARSHIGTKARAQAQARLDWNLAAERLRRVFQELSPG